jgi:hypothetical protein
VFTCCPKITGENKEALSKLTGEHKVHPYLHMEILCGGESQFVLPGTFFKHPRLQPV